MGRLPSRGDPSECFLLRILCTVTLSDDIDSYDVESDSECMFTSRFADLM